MGVFRFKDKKHYGSDEAVAEKIKEEKGKTKLPLAEMKPQPKKKAESKKKGEEIKND